MLSSLKLRIRFLLKRDGSLRAPPLVVESHASLLGKEAADKAAQAILHCSPFDLPPEKWKAVQIRITP